MARGRGILSPGTYGKVQVREIGGTWRAQTRARPHGADTSRTISRCDPESPEDAEDRLREYLHDIGLRDARNGAVSLRENVTEGQDQHDGETVQAGDFDRLADHSIRRHLRVWVNVPCGKASHYTIPLYDALYDVLVNAGHRQAADLLHDLATGERAA